jgi:hypothetical protein
MEKNKLAEHAAETSKQDRIENARVGYQAAVNLWTYEGQLIWARFSAMLLANSIVVAVIGIVISADRALPVFSVGMPIAGLILCLVWTLMTARGFDYYKHWGMSACELEDRFLSDPVQTVYRVGDFKAKKRKKIEVLIGGETEDYRMSWLGHVARVKWASYLVIIVFGALYFTALVWN